ncbi:hypothetical protein J0S82_016483, partial [Galemys pyrenaicus]
MSKPSSSEEGSDPLLDLSLQRMPTFRRRWLSFASAGEQPSDRLQDPACPEVKELEWQRLCIESTDVVKVVDETMKCLKVLQRLILRNLQRANPQPNRKKISASPSCSEKTMESQIPTPVCIPTFF